MKYVFDPRSRPPNLDVADFEGFVKTELQNSVKDLHESLTNFVLGALSLDGLLPDGPLAPEVRSSLVPRIVQLRFESEGTTKGLDAGTEITNRRAYQLIHQEIEAIRLGVNGGSPSTAYYEELAFVSRELLANATEVPIDAPGLRDRVRIALSEYVPGEAGGTLQLPSLSAPTPAGAELLSDNIRAVALIYAAWNLEEMKLFQVLDRTVEVFMNGQLPVGFDNGGRALSEYYFDDDDQRLTEAARRMTYSRVLGVPGGEVSREAPPNRGFNDLFLRFMATVAEFDRQRRIDDIILNAQRADVLSNTGEQVRKAGFDLAANASLYGYGGTFFVARRLARQTERALRILSVPEIMSAYGVHSPFQVVERVCATDLGGKVPNVARLKTMAEAGKAILDIVARHTVAWQGSTGRPLFDDPVSSGGGSSEDDRVRQPDIPRFERDELTRNVDHWLAVNGIKDEQRSRLGEPEVSSPVASIPTVGGDSSGSAAFDQLRQMVSAGQTPSLDQLKALLPDAGGMVRT